MTRHSLLIIVREDRSPLFSRRSAEEEEAAGVNEGEKHEEDHLNRFLSKGFGSQFMDVMIETMHFLLEHLARAG